MMKLTTFTTLFLVAILSLGTIVKSSKKDAVNPQSPAHAFLYKFDFKNHTNRPELERTDYILVNKKGNTTFMQYYNQMKRDSIFSHRKMSGQDLYDFRINDFPYTIKTVDNKATFTAEVGDQYFQYEEQLQFKWKISNTTRKINTYNCQLATIKYAGRTWNAWFTKEIAMDVGPYKFKGLPGCIVEISDTNEVFKYTLVRYVDKKVVQLDHYPYVAKKTIEKTTRKEFNEHQQAYIGLGFEQRMAYLRRNQGGVGKIKLVSNDDSGVDFKNKSLDEMDAYNFIEIDHID